MDEMLIQLFQSQIKVQCEFALRAVEDINEGLKSDGERLFHGLQAFVVCAGNISAALWGVGKNQKEATPRRAPLRESLGVTESSKLAPSSRWIRNSYEHFDERLDTWW